MVSYTFLLFKLRTLSGWFGQLNQDSTLKVPLINLLECQESNPLLLGEKIKRYLRGVPCPWLSILYTFVLNLYLTERNYSKVLPKFWIIADSGKILPNRISVVYSRTNLNVFLQLCNVELPIVLWMTVRDEYSCQFLALVLQFKSFDETFQDFLWNGWGWWRLLDWTLDFLSKQSMFVPVLKNFLAPKPCTREEHWMPLGLAVW